MNCETYLVLKYAHMPEFSKLNGARAFTSRARAELRAHFSNIFRARAEPSLTIIEPSMWHIPP